MLQFVGKILICLLHNSSFPAPIEPGHTHASTDRCTNPIPHCDVCCYWWAYSLVLWHYIVSAVLNNHRLNTIHICVHTYQLKYIYSNCCPGLIIVMSEALSDDSMFSLLMVATVWEVDQFYAIYCRHQTSKMYFPWWALFRISVPCSHLFVR